MKIFVAGCNFPEKDSIRAAEAALVLQSEGHEVYDPIAYENILVKDNDFFKIDSFEDIHMRALMTCDAIFVLKGAQHDGKVFRYIKAAIADRKHIFFEEE